MSALDHWKADGTNFTSNGHTFTVDEQLYINRQAVSAWQVGMVVGQVRERVTRIKEYNFQMFHLFSARSLRESMFKHGFFTNKVCLGCILCVRRVTFSGLFAHRVHLIRFYLDFDLSLSLGLGVKC